MNIKNIKIFKKLSIILFSILTINFNYNIKACDNNNNNNSASFEKLNYLSHLPVELKKLISMHLIKIETNLGNFENHFDEILSGIQALKNLTQINKHFNNFINSSEFIELIANSFYKKTNNILLSTLLANKITNSNNNIAFNWLENRLEEGKNTNLLNNLQSCIWALFTTQSLNHNSVMEERKNVTHNIYATMEKNQQPLWLMLYGNNLIRDFLFKELKNNILIVPKKCLTSNNFFINKANNLNRKHNSRFINELIVYTCLLGDLKLLKDLFKYYTESNKFIFLVNACSSKNIEMVKMLLSYADGSIKNDANKTVLNMALINASLAENIEIIELLLKYQANPDYELNNILTPLKIAISNKNLKMVELLLQNDANANYFPQNALGDTPLTTACKLNNIKIVELLLRHNANINATNFFGETALDIAKNKGFKDIAKLISPKESSCLII